MRHFELFSNTCDFEWFPNYTVRSSPEYLMNLKLVKWPLMKLEDPSHQRRHSFKGWNRLELTTFWRSTTPLKNCRKLENFFGPYLFGLGLELGIPRISMNDQFSAFSVLLGYEAIDTLHAHFFRTLQFYDWIAFMHTLLVKTNCTWNLQWADPTQHSVWKSNGVNKKSH